MAEQFLRCAPFLGVLLSFAVVPGIAPRFWHRRVAWLIGFWIALAFLGEAAAAGPAVALAGFWQNFLGEFLPFMVLLLALYALGGGIAIEGGPWGRPWGNALLLLIGTLLASVMGTTGASLLLIHPLLSANAQRPEKRHLVLAFIILAGNCGGALTPLGDPPLLVGFLRGVPFLWSAAHLWPFLLVAALPILLACLGYDLYLARREPMAPVRRLRVRGWLNIVLLLFIVAATIAEGVWHPGSVSVLGATLPGEALLFTLFAALCIAASERFTPQAIRRQNRFAWGAMREITLLFLAIFLTIPPVFGLLQQAAIVPGPLAWFWASGIASAILDAAPTYLIFFEAAGGKAAELTAEPAHLLTAIAAGSVMFGPLTYLGNAPNLMIREIAARRGVRMPGFFTYAGIMILVMIPALLVMSLLFL